MATFIKMEHLQDARSSQEFGPFEYAQLTALPVSDPHFAQGVMCLS